MYKLRIEITTFSDDDRFSENFPLIRLNSRTLKDRDAEQKYSTVYGHMK